MDEVKNIVALRTELPDDRSFIFSSWLKSFRHSPFAKPMTNTVYFEAHHAVIDDLINRSQLVIACNPEDQTQIYGYIVAEVINGIFTVHYTYVKHTYRKLGIANLLLSAFDRDPSLLACYTHHTYFAERIANSKNLLYHPYLIAPELEAGQTFDEDADEVNAINLESEINSETEEWSESE